jgi:hypothetical protein
MNVFSIADFDNLLLAAIPQIWFAIPLIVVVSLVYGATRHENLPEIFAHSLRNAIWCVGFMSIIFFLIWVAGFWN